MHMHQADVLYLCTPNNPTGTLPKRKVLMDLVEYAKKTNCDIVLDEAFIDFISEQSSLISDINLLSVDYSSLNDKNVRNAWSKARIHGNAPCHSQGNSTTGTAFGM